MLYRNTIELDVLNPVQQSVSTQLSTWERNKGATASSYPVIFNMLLLLFEKKKKKNGGHLLSVHWGDKTKKIQQLNNCMLHLNAQ